MKDASQSVGTCHNFVAQSFLLFPPCSFFFSLPCLSHDPTLLVLNSIPFPCYNSFPLTTQFLSRFVPLLLTIFPFLLQLYLSVSFLSFGDGWFLFHPFPQPPLEVNESRRLSSFTRHRFHVGQRRAANRVNSSPLVERGSVFPFHHGGAILPASKRPDLFTSIRSLLLIPFLRNRRFLACEWALAYPICFVLYITGMRRKNFLIRLICWNEKYRTWLIIMKSWSTDLIER